MIKVFWDLDNIKPKHPAAWYNGLKDFLSKIDNDIEIKAYTNGKALNHEFIEILNDSLNFVRGKLKNAVDTVISIDLMETMYENKINLFVIISSDIDFSPVISKIKKYKIPIIIIGEDYNQYSDNEIDFFIDTRTIKNNIFPPLSLEKSLTGKDPTISIEEASLLAQLTIYLLIKKKKKVNIHNLDIEMKKNPNFKYFGAHSIKGFNLRFKNFIELLLIKNKIKKKDGTFYLSSYNLRFLSIQEVTTIYSAVINNNQIKNLSHLSILMREYSNGLYQGIKSIDPKYKLNKFSQLIDLIKNQLNSGENKNE